ncbi:hypothetical protein AAA135_11090, partial [[Eubacterium] siraeum]
YHKYVNYVLAHSVNYVITLYRLAPPVTPNLSIPTTFSKAHPPPHLALNLPPLPKVRFCCSVKPSQLWRGLKLIEALP